MKLAFYAYLQKLIAVAATVTGKKFGLLVATSVIATSGIVASALTGSGGIGPAAAAMALLNDQPAAATTAATPEPAPEEAFSQPSSPEPVPTPEPSSSEPLPESVPSAAPETLPGPEPEPPAPPPPPSEPKLPEAGPVKHVFLISLASPGYEAAFGTSSQMPYLSGTLRQQGVLLTNYSLLGTSSLANGFAAIGGQAPTAASEADCPEYEKCLFPAETLDLAGQLSTGRFTWHAYLEEMADAEGKPGNCVHPEPDAAEAPPVGGYAAKLNPFVFFHSLLDLGDCAANDTPLSELAGDLKKPDSTANFSYIAPTLCNSGFRGQCPEGTADGAAAADAFVEKLVPEILSSPAYKRDGLVIVSFGAADPAPPTDPAAAPADPLKVGGLLISPLLTAGGTDGTAYTPYSLLRSVDELFGLAPLGEAEGKKVHSFAAAFIAGETTAGD